MLKNEEENHQKGKKEIILDCEEWYNDYTRMTLAYLLRFRWWRESKV